VYARFSTFAATPTDLDTGVAFCRDDAMTALQHVAGFIGLSLLADRTDGECILTSAWKTEDAMHASRDLVAPIRARISDLVHAAGRANVEEYEIALMHRAHRAPPGAYVRGIWCRMDADRIEDAIDTYRMSTLASLEELAGFCSTTLFCQRESGRCCVSITYDSRAAFDAVRDEADELRASTMKTLDVQLERSGEYELAVARFHVPELV